MKKTVVLSGLRDASQKAIMNLEKVNDQFVGDFRLYNVALSLEGIVSVGVLCRGKVFKAVAKALPNMCYSFTIPAEEELKYFTVAIVLTYQGETKPIFVGAFGGKADLSINTRLAKATAVLKDDLSVENARKALDDNQIDYCDYDKREIEREIDCEMQKESCVDTNCKSCKYKEAFYFEGGKTTNLQKNATFYEALMPQLDELFEKYEKDEQLEKIIPNSKWVRVDWQGDGDYYVLGLIYKGVDVMYVCYGVPGIYTSSPPKEFEGLCKWLPVDELKPFETGYWIIYQNAENGENENIEVV